MKITHLYHWTHASNLRNILARGLSPEYSEGALPRVWLASHARIAWACVHASSHHGWDADDMVCLRVNIAEVDTQQTAMNGVYTCKHTIKPEQIDAVLRSIGSPWTNPHEKK